MEEIVVDKQDFLEFQNEIQDILDELSMAQEYSADLMQAFEPSGEIVYFGMASEPGYSFFYSMNSHVKILQELVEGLGIYMKEYLESMSEADENMANAINSTIK